MSVPSGLVPTRITELTEYSGSSSLGYVPYVIGGVTYKVQIADLAGFGGMATVADIEALTPADGDLVYLYQAGRGGVFVFDDSDLSAYVTSDTEQGLYIAPSSDSTGDSGAWVRQFDDYVLPEWFGATGDGSTDDSAAIQAALDAYPNVHFRPVTYIVQSPLTIEGNQKLIGSTANEGGVNNLTIIKKSGTTTGSGSNTSPSTGAVTDSYAVNAVLIAKHGNGAYNYSCVIKSIRFEGTGTYTTNFGIYAPRISQWLVEDVLIHNCETGIQVNDGWMSTFLRVTVNCNTIDTLLAAARSISTNGWTSSTTRGFYWKADGGGGGSGTSVEFINCWARYCHIGFSITNLVYSGMHGCGADNMENGAYHFSTSRVTLTNCGMEQVVCQPAINCSNSRIQMIGCDANTGIYGVSGVGFYRVDTAGELILNGCKFGDFTTVNSALNRVIQETSHVVETQSDVPSNGSSFVSYSASSTRLAIDNGVITYSDANGSNILKRMSDAPGGQLFKKDKTILSAGSSIMTITASGVGTRDYAAGKIKMFYSDQTSANGAGFIEAAFCCYRESSSYYEAVNQDGLDARAGSSFTTSPVFSIAVATDVWTITVTPGHGDCVAELIDVEWYEAVAGDVTVALT